jgi:two-component system alkaline phosphatase synthesis response regulator PhoP
MARETILIVEDETDIAEMVVYNLSREGYRAAAVTSGEDALHRLRQAPFDLVLLDLMLPGLDGLELCRRLKQEEKTRAIPVVMLTAKSEESDIIAGLELGAEDYITKPFSPRVLVARVRAVLRRIEQRESAGKQAVLRIHGLEIDTKKHEAHSGGRLLDLSATEFAVLVFLASNPGWVFSRNQIISAVKGEDYPVTERAVDVQMLGLRRKLGEQGGIIETVRGIGYRMREPEA